MQVYVFVYTWVPKKPREDIASPRAGVIYGDESPEGSWEQYSHPLEE